MPDDDRARLIDVGDTKLNVAERGREHGYPLLVLHGGPGLDHHMFGDYLDPLGDPYRLLLVDERAQGRSEPAPEDTWTIERMAADIAALARALDLIRYAVLGHSFGAFLALQHAVDFPGFGQTIVSHGVPSARYLGAVSRKLAEFEPVELREQITRSWEQELEAQTQEDTERLLADQMPFHFADPRDPRIEEYERRSAGARYAPDVGRSFAAREYGEIELEDRLGEIRHPVLVLTGGHERTCAPEASEAMAKAIPGAALVVFEHSAHMSFVEENEANLTAVRDFLDQHTD
jgi:proline iminopeptidase